MFMMSDLPIERQIYDLAISCGFDNCGIIPIEDMDGFSEHLQERIRRIPSSAFLYDSVGNLSGTKERFPWAKSVIICTCWLGKYRFPASLQGKYAKSFFLAPGNEMCREFHENCKRFEAWFAQRNIRCEGGKQSGHLSIGPLRYAAMKAGLGIIRKNNFLYTEKGSFVDLTGYVIDRECVLYHTPDIKPCAEKCSLCQKSCPSGALKGPYTMSPLECVSFLTTFGKGKLLPGMDDRACGTWICGCDSCQDACPHNRRHDWENGIPYPGLEELAPELQPERLLLQSDEFLQKRLIPYTEHHVMPDEAETLRLCAERSIRNKGIG